jgi:flagellin-like hook-associated protein FlgL
MANDVVISAALRNNLSSLQSTQRLIDTVQLRLATGLKVNSALDGPQQFFTSQSLNNRAGDLTRLLDGINLSIRTIEEADKGVTALTKLVEQAQSVAEEAQSEIRSTQGFAAIRGTVDLRAIEDLTASGAITADDDISIQIRTDDDTVLNSTDINIAAGSDIYDIIALINGNANIGTGAADGPYVRASLTSSGQLKIESLVEGATLRIASGAGADPGLDGFAALGLDGYVSLENNIGATRIGGTIVAGRTITSDVSAVGEDAGTGLYYATATLSAAGYVNAFAAGGADDLNISIDVDGQTTALGVDFTVDSTIQSVVDAITDANIDGVESATFNQETGRIEITFADSVSRAEIVYTAEDAGGVSFGFGAGAAGYNGTTNDVVLAAAGNAVSENLIFAGSSVNLAQYESDFNSIRSQIDDLVSDASYRGVNLLTGGKLETFFNEDRTSSLTTQGVDFTAGGLGIDEAEFLTAGDVTKSIEQIRVALDDVRNFGQSIANSLSIIQTRRDFTESTISTLKAGANDLVAADQNEEGANLLALQTRQQLGVTALSLAAQSQQSVLRLF